MPCLCHSPLAPPHPLAGRPEPLTLRTVATLKEHAFFEEIEDWRFVGALSLHAPAGLLCARQPSRSSHAHLARGLPTKLVGATCQGPAPDGL